MNIPDEVLDLGLKPSEFYLLAVLFRHSNSAGVVELTMESLSDLTGSSRTTIWRDMSGLEEKGLVDTHRTKRNLGKFYKNKYQLLSPCFKSETREVEIKEMAVLPCFKNETSTADYITTSNTSKLVKAKVKNTSYSLWGDAPKLNVERFKEVKMVNRWSDDDDSIGGFGLLDGEVPASQKKPVPSKRDARTRHQRPQQEWTPSDVAAEFSSQLYDKIRGIPGLINISKLAPILGKRRKDHGTNALIELEVLNMLMGDERRLADVKKEPHNAWRMYLKLLSTHGKQAIDNLGFEEETVVDIIEASEYVYATDGKRFDNSMPGRKALELYEEKLRRE